MRDVGVILIPPYMDKNNIYIKSTFDNFISDKPYLLSILETTSDIVFVLDIESKQICFVNKMISTFLNISENELFENELSVIEQLIHPDDTIRFNKEIQNIVSTIENKIVETTFNLKNKDGQFTLFNFRISILNYNEKRKPVNVILFAQKNEEHSQNEILLNNIFESFPYSIFFKNKQGVFKKCSKDLAEYLGFNVESIIDQTVYNFDIKERADFHTKVDEELLVNGGRIKYESTILFADQSNHFVQIVKSAVLDSMGRIIGIIGIMTDITEQKMMEEALEESKKRYRLLFESAGEAIFIHGLDGRIVDVNMTACRRLGYGRYELLNMNIKDITSSDYRVLYNDRLQKLEQNIHSLFRSENITKDGNIIFTDDSMSFFEYSGKKNILIISRDITNQVQAQKQIEASLDEKEILLKEIHHRVKNNFQIITSLLSLQEKNVHDERLLAQFYDAKNRIRSMALIHEKLYQSKDFSKINMAEYITAMSQELYHTYYYELKKVDLNYDLKNVFIELEKAIPCGLIINEILTNSFKYAFPKDFNQSAVINISLQQNENNKIKLKIGDNGVGIPENIDIEKTDTLGLQLISILSSQLNGHNQLIRNPGTEWTIEF